MSAVTKARFNRRRKVIGIRSRFLPGSTAMRSRRRLPTGAEFASAASHFDDGIGKGLRRLLRQVVSDAPGDEAVGIFAGKLPGIDLGVRMRRAVGVAFEGDGGHADGRGFGQPLFQIVVFRLARGETK